MNYKHVACLSVIPMLSLIGCPASPAVESPEGGSKSAPVVAKYQPPATRPGENGWLVYVDAESMTPEKAKGFAPGTSSPEGAILHFYASRMRGDDRWEEVLVSKRGRRLERKLNKIAAWNFLEVKLVRRKKAGGEPDALWIKIFMRIEVKPGKVDSGIDDVGVRKVNGKWLVTSVPT